MKNTITEISSSVDELSRRMELTEERISKHEQRTREITYSEQYRKNRLGKKNEQSLRDLQDVNKISKHMLSESQKERREKARSKVL